MWKKKNKISLISPEKLRAISSGALGINLFINWNLYLKQKAQDMGSSEIKSR